MENEYHCNFCGSTGTKLRNEEKGCCNSCGAPLGITKEKAKEIWNGYNMEYPYLGTGVVYLPCVPQKES